MDSLSDLFEYELRDTYSAENQVAQILSQLTGIVSSPPLRSAINQSLQATRTQISRLEDIASDLSLDIAGETCEGVAGLISELQELRAIDGDREVLDAAMVAAVQKLEHYQISAYGTLSAHARNLDLDPEIIDSLEESLQEEKNLDIKLTELAEIEINPEADK